MCFKEPIWRSWTSSVYWWVAARVPAFRRLRIVISLYNISTQFFGRTAYFTEEGCQSTRPVQHWNVFEFWIFEVRPSYYLRVFSSNQLSPGIDKMKIQQYSSMNSRLFIKICALFCKLPRYQYFSSWQLKRWNFHFKSLSI